MLLQFNWATFQNIQTLHIHFHSIKVLFCSSGQLGDCTKKQTNYENSLEYNTVMLWIESLIYDERLELRPSENWQNIDSGTVMT